MANSQPSLPSFDVLAQSYLDSPATLVNVLEAQGSAAAVVSVMAMDDAPFREASSDKVIATICQHQEALEAFAAEDALHGPSRAILLCAAIHRLALLPITVNLHGLLQQAKTCAGEQSNRSLRGALLMAEADSILNSHGMQAYAELVERAIIELPEDAPWRQIRLGQLATRLGFRGELIRLRRVLGLPPPGREASEYHPLTLLAAFVDAVECGRLAEVGILYQALSGEEALIELNAGQQDVVKTYADVADVIEAAGDQHKRIDDLAATSSQHTTLFFALLQRNFTDIRNSLDACSENESLLSSPLFGYMPVRLALALFDAEAARSFMELRTANGQRHYLDDFFWARIALIENQHHEAARLLRHARQQAMVHGAWGRIEFELRLAPELHSANVLNLLDGDALDPHERQRSVFDDDLDLADQLRQAEALSGLGHVFPGNSKPAIGLRQQLSTVIGQRPQQICLVGPAGCGVWQLASNIASEWARQDGLDQPLIYSIDCQIHDDANWQRTLEEQSQAALRGGSLIILNLDHANQQQLGHLKTFLRAVPNSLLSQPPTPTSAGFHIIWCSEQHLIAQACQGLFCADLFAGLGHPEIQVPALNQRSEDIPALMQRFALESLREQGREGDGETLWISKPGYRAIMNLPWHGDMAALRLFTRTLIQSNASLIIDDEVLMRSLHALGLEPTSSEIASLHE